MDPLIFVDDFLYHPNSASFVGCYDLAFGAFLQRFWIAKPLKMLIHFDPFCTACARLLQISDVATATSDNATNISIIHIHLFHLTSKAWSKALGLLRLLESWVFCVPSNLNPEIVRPFDGISKSKCNFTLTMKNLRDQT